MKGSEIVSEILRFFQLVETTAKVADEEINRCDQEYNDLTHAAELLALNAVEMSQLMKEIRVNRKKRRVSKNTKEQMTPILEVLQKNQGLINALKVAKGKIESVERTQEVRVYTPRVRTEMTAAFEKQHKA